MTDGVLLAEISHDRDLRRYDTIIIDEAHERSLNIDFLLGYLKLLAARRPDLKIIVTSATIDTDRFAAHFADVDGVSAPIIEVSGRTYPVEIRYRPILADGEADQVGGICAAITELSALGDGDILVFCSGEREIRDAADAITAMDLRRTEVLPLYARLSAAEQHRVFTSHAGRRIVLATNVAETSLTVPGIRYVVDPGTARMSRYSARTKVQRLPIEPISQASANQRAGRCGRVAPGCLHPAVRRGGLREPPRVHRAGDPAHQPGVGDLADDRGRPRCDRHLPVRRGARRQSDQRRPPAADRARRAVVRPGGAASADRHRTTARPDPGGPPDGPDAAGGRAARLPGRDHDHRRRAVHPGPAGAAGRGPGQGRGAAPSVLGAADPAPDERDRSGAPRHPSRTAATSRRTCGCGTTCAASRRPCPATPSDGCVGRSTCTSCGSGSGRTCTRSCATSPGT